VPERAAFRNILGGVALLSAPGSTSGLPSLPTPVFFICLLRREERALMRSKSQALSPGSTSRTSALASARFAECGLYVSSRDDCRKAQKGRVAPNPSPLPSIYRSRRRSDGIQLDPASTEGEGRRPVCIAANGLDAAVPLRGVSASRVPCWVIKDVAQLRRSLPFAFTVETGAVVPGGAGLVHDSV